MGSPFNGQPEPVEICREETRLDYWDQIGWLNFEAIDNDDEMLSESQ